MAKRESARPPLRKFISQSGMRLGLTYKIRIPNQVPVENLQVGRARLRNIGNLKPEELLPNLRGAQNARGSGQCASVGRSRGAHAWENLTGGHA